MWETAELMLTLGDLWPLLLSEKEATDPFGASMNEWLSLRHKLFNVYINVVILCCD